MNLAALRKGLASAFIVVFVGLQVSAVVVAKEDYPLTATPMFAHRATLDTPRYRLRFRLHRPEARKRKWTTLAAKRVRLRDAGLMRTFFIRWYGGVGFNSPFDVPGDDGVQAFERRMSDFFGRLVRALPAKRRRGITQVRLELQRVQGRGRYTDTRRLGTYDVASARYVHEWRGATP